jgi:transposase InsO family protein
MGSVADCFDNALAESVFATIECELFDQQTGGRFTSRREAKLAVFDYLETFYNPRRRHSALGQISPAAFEARHTASTAAA